MEKRISGKDALIEELKGELAACKSIPGKEGENQPSMIKELENCLFMGGCPHQNTKER